MKTKVDLSAIAIRTDLRPGDIGYIVYLHGRLYKEECDYGIGLEAYVAEGLAEFYKQYDPKRDRVWICEFEGRIVGFLALMHRDKETAQLRYFLLCDQRGGPIPPRENDLPVAILAGEKNYGKKVH